MESKSEKKRLLADLKNLARSNGFTPNQVESLLTTHQARSLEEIKESIKKHENLNEKTARVSQLVETYNEIMSQEMDAFRKEANEIIDSFLAKKAKERGLEYQPSANPSRKIDSEDEHH